MHAGADLLKEGAEGGEVKLAGAGAGGVGHLGLHPVDGGLEEGVAGMGEKEVHDVVHSNDELRSEFGVVHAAEGEDVVEALVEVGDIRLRQVRKGSLGREGPPGRHDLHTGEEQGRAGLRDAGPPVGLHVHQAHLGELRQGLPDGGAAHPEEFDEGGVV